MIQIGKTLYILNDKTYIHFEHDTLIIETENNKQRVPMKVIQQIIVFGNTSISNYLIKECAEANILISYISPSGKYYGSFYGKNVGNVVLRQKQYRLYDDVNMRLSLVKNIVLGKALNQKQLLESYGQRAPAHKISSYLNELVSVTNLDSVRGIEGKISSEYFSGFDDILRQSRTDSDMLFEKRTKHPPENNCNALLSFLYTMLNINCISALECFGLDSYLGFLHELRSGRESLASDLIEEFRSPLVDKKVITWIKDKVFTGNDFTMESNVPKLKDEARKQLLQKWEDARVQEIYYPLYDKYVPEKILPYLQAQLLSQYIRGDIPEYPPWYCGG